MARARVTTDDLITGLDAVKERLRRVDVKLADLSDVWDEIGQVLADRQRTVFTSRGIGADKWEPRAREAVGRSSPLLVDTGTMRDGLTSGRPIWERPLAAAWGADMSDRRVFNVAVLHNSGTKRMPRRVVTPRLRAAERKRLVAVVADYMQRVID